MDDQFYTAFIALLIPVIIGRVILSNSTKKLTVEKKEDLDKSLSGTSILRYIAILIGAISSVFFPKSILILLPILVIGGTLFYWLKISKAGMPKEYMNSFFISAALGLVGMTLFLLLNKEIIFQ